MTLASGQRAHAARLLREAEHHVAPTEPLSALLPGLDLADAYAVQQENIARRLADGATVVGHKVGLTATAMQRLLRRGRPACRGALRRTRRGVGDVRLIRGNRARRRTPVRSGGRDARRTVGTGRAVEACRDAR
ncbi:hypothetical protein ACWGA9_04630 [Streptomyces sp. NPDC054950]